MEIFQTIISTLKRAALWNGDLLVTRSIQEETVSKGPAWNVQEIPGLCSEWTQSLLPQGLGYVETYESEHGESLLSKMFFLFFLVSVYFFPSAV